MNLRKILALVYSDYRRYRATGGQDNSSLLGVLLLTQGFWASAVYRFSHAITNIKQSFLRRPLRIFFLFVEKGVEVFTGIRIPGECTIGKGLYLGHFGNLILNDQVVIGDNCNLSQGVTIGIAQRGDKAGVPVIGDRVYIGPNAVLFGGIRIGSDVAIGAGSIVMHSFEQRSVVGGNPAKLLSRAGSFELIHYDQMDQDSERIVSLSMREITK